MKRLILSTCVVLAVGCGPQPGPPDAGGGDDKTCEASPTSVTTATMQTEIFDKHCKSCHAVGLTGCPNATTCYGDYSSAAKSQESVGKASPQYAQGAESALKIVEANNLKNSTLYLKVLGGSPTHKGPNGGSVGGIMPQVGNAALTAAEKTTVKNWICSGAKAQ